jgi:hypothetical protein
MSKKKLFEVDGFEVYEDSIYVVNDKIDHDAPSGFLEKGTTRLPSSGVADTFYCPFQPTGQNGKGIWDTGFYADSPCYERLDSTDKNIIVKAIKENILKPFAALKGGVDVLSHTNNEFWDLEKFKVYSGQVLNANNTTDRVTLYFALRHKKLCPKGKESSPLYRDTAYTVVDVNNDVKRKDEKVANMFASIKHFTTLLQNDRSRLISMLEYMGIRLSEGIEDTSLVSIFNEYLQSNESHVGRFNTLIEQTSTAEGQEMIEVYLKLKKAVYRGDVEKAKNGSLHLGEKELGGDLRVAAENIAKKKEFNSIKKQLLFDEELTLED